MTTRSNKVVMKIEWRDFKVEIKRLLWFINALFVFSACIVCAWGYTSPSIIVYKQ